MPVVVAGVTGMLVDSLLGATLQGLYECPACGARFERAGTVCHEAVRLIRGTRWLDNDGVNLAATLAGAAVAALGTARSWHGPLGCRGGGSGAGRLSRGGAPRAG